MNRTFHPKGQDRPSRPWVRMLQVLPFTAALPGVKSHAQWAREVTIGLSILVLLLIVYTAIFHWRRLLEPTVKWLCLISICILPLFAAGLGSVAVFEVGKTKEFCGSCHPVMDPYYADLNDPTSKTLAAVHFTNRFIQKGACYACHVTYGLHGTAKAKLNGLSHVYHFIMSSWHVPIELYEPYSNINCLHCHAEAKKFQGEATHQAVAAELISDGLSCLDCHARAHPREASKTPRLESAGRKQ